MNPPVEIGTRLLEVVADCAQAAAASVLVAILATVVAVALVLRERP
jgi:hypothetical protein